MKRIKVYRPAPSRSAEIWARLVEDWRRSGLGTRRFCQARGLSVKTFQWWRWALMTRRGGSPHRQSPLGSSKSLLPAQSPASVASAPAFIEIVARPAITPLTASVRRPSGIEVLVAGPRGERRVRVDAEFDASTLRKVVTALEEV